MLKSWRCRHCESANVVWQRKEACRSMQLAAAFSSVYQLRAGTAANFFTRELCRATLCPFMSADRRSRA
eukprot:6195396-Pleurochrysis_carterae.AAC.3